MSDSPKEGVIPELPKKVSAWVGRDVESAQTRLTGENPPSVGSDAIVPPVPITRTLRLVGVLERDMSCAILILPQGRKGYV